MGAADLAGLSSDGRARLREARDDVGVFAELLVGEPLWPHQLDAARSPARIRVLRAGRQVGKSRLLAILALWEAFRAADRHVLLLSASDDNAKDLLAEVADLATAPLLAGSVVDEQASKLVLDNGSWIRSIPASPKQARGKSIDLLVIDEAAFVSEEVWRAAKYSQAARPGSRLLLSSSPYGRRDAFFAVHDRLGADGGSSVGGVSVESFVWPSTVSPLVQRAGLVEFWRRTDPPRTFAAEVLAEWQDDAGAYFTADELEGSTADFVMVDPCAGRFGPGSAPASPVVAGVDWGMRADSNTVAFLGVLDDGGRNVGRVQADEPVFVVPWLEEHVRTPYTVFIDRLVRIFDRRRGGFDVRMVASETNGVGDMPTQVLKDRRRDAGLEGAWVAAVHTDAKRKENAFGAMKLLMQAGRLLLPRHPGLLSQLAALEFETRESGAVSISVPERAGHDDLAMALAQALSMARTRVAGLRAFSEGDGGGELLETPRGVLVHEHPRLLDVTWWRSPKGRENDERGW